MIAVWHRMSARSLLRSCTFWGESFPREFRSVSMTTLPSTRSMAAGPNEFETAQRQFDKCAELLNLDPNLRRVLRSPQRILEVHFPVHMDDGGIQMFTGYRVQHNLHRGPTKGG